MTNRQPAIRRSQKPSCHQSIEDAPPMLLIMGGWALSPNVWRQRSTPFARMILSLGSIGRISGAGVGGCCGAWAFWTCFRALLESRSGRQPLFEQADPFYAFG